MSDHDDAEKKSDSTEELEKRFKQERKELQAKIQVLKKSAIKGDKKKKREVQEEIIKLEGDLEQRHKIEEENCRQNSLVSKDLLEGSKEILADGNQEDEESGSHVRITKAEKRRQKKVAASKDRDARIQEQEGENLQGPRHKEMVAIVENLRKRGLAIHGIIADGNCLYSAVEHQLKETDGPHSELDYKALRKLTADYLREHCDDFLPFLTNQDTGDPMSEDDYEAYCRKVEKTTAWGGQIELRAISDVLKHPIEVIQAVGPSITIGEQYVGANQLLVVTFHRYLYRLGEHYNSVCPYVEDDQEN